MAVWRFTIDLQTVLSHFLIYYWLTYHLPAVLFDTLFDHCPASVVCLGMYCHFAYYLVLLMFKLLSWTTINVSTPVLALWLERIIIFMIFTGKSRFLNPIPFCCFHGSHELLIICPSLHQCLMYYIKCLASVFIHDSVIFLNMSIVMCKWILVEMHFMWTNRYNRPWKSSYYSILLFYLFPVFSGTVTKYEGNAYHWV